MEVTNLDVAALMLAVVLLAALVWLSAGFLAWKYNDGSKPYFFCYHYIMYGGGAMGDSCKCTRCGLETYDGFNSHLWIYRLLGRVEDPRSFCM